MRVNKKAKRLLLYFVTFLFGIFLLYGLYVFFASPKMYIDSIIVSPPEYQDLVSTYTKPILEDKHLYLIPTNHTAFIPFSKLKKELQTNIQEIESITIKHKGLKALTVDIVLRKPLFRLEHDLAVDKLGVVYKEPTNIDHLPLFLFKNTLPQTETLLGFESLAKKLSTLIKPVTRIEVDEHGDVYYYFYQSNATVITRVSSSTEALWSTLVSAVATDPLKTSLETQNPNLNYIDLRFGNKVFYKFGKSVSIATTTKPYDQGILAEPNRQ
jgi:cell division septal protein FtsQ